MNEPQDRIYNSFIGFRAPGDFIGRFDRFSRRLGRNRSAVARYLIAQCLNAYEGDTDAIAKIKQEIL